MSMEHIFRNLNDIRVFDALAGFTKKEDAVHIDDIMEILELPQREQIQIEDSTMHLVEQRILEIVYSPEEYSSGCKTCKKTDDAGLPRKKRHKGHEPIEYGIEQVETYYLADNDLTKLLVSAVFENSGIYAEKIMKEKGIEHIKEEK